MIKFDSAKHVELISIADEVLAIPNVMRIAADLAEGLPAHVEFAYPGLLFFRDKTEDELPAGAKPGD